MNSEALQIVSLSFKTAPLERVGKLHLTPEDRLDKLQEWKRDLEVGGVVYLSTCNRVEFIFSDTQYFCTGRLHRLLSSFHIQGTELGDLVQAVETYRGDVAMKHLMRVSCGMESMVLGEREVLSQMREAFDFSTSHKLAGDHLRITGRVLIETAKAVFTETQIGSKQVSINSIGWEALKECHIPIQDNILIIGAGQTNTNISRFIANAGFRNVTVLNRTGTAAQNLADQHGWQWNSLSNLHEHLQSGPRAIVICTGSTEALLDGAAARAIPEGELSVLDLGLPADTNDAFRMRPQTHVVDLEVLQSRIAANLAIRNEAINSCETLISEGFQVYLERLKQRQMEMAMRDLPATISAIRETALGEVFADDLAQLDSNTRELIDRIVSYMEKKYVGVPMKLARKAVLEQLRKS